MSATLATEISRLTPVEKLQLVEKIWDDLAANVDRLPLPAWHEKALAEEFKNLPPMANIGPNVTGVSHSQKAAT